LRAWRRQHGPFGSRRGLVLIRPAAFDLKRAAEGASPLAWEADVGAWGSLIAGAPFTIQYAREQTPPQVWHTPLFLRINQAITAVWGLSFFLSAMISLYRHATGDDSLVTRYGWVVLSAAALVFTVYFPDWYRARALRAAAPPVSPR
jgi:hypothetical protein